MSIELKHIVGYLPYDLLMKSKNDFVSPLFRKLTVDGFQFHLDNRTPVLIPLSELSSYHMAVLRQIRFPNSEQWTKQHYNFIKTVKSFPELQMLNIVQKLYEWHFDVHGLIEKGLAIDKSKLP